MTKSDFCNALDNYIGHDQMQSALRLVEKATGLDVSTIMTIFSFIEDDYNKVEITPDKFKSRQPGYRSPAQLNHIKQRRRTMGYLVYTELLNLHSRYTFSGNIMVYNINKFNFKRHFEHI